MRCRILTLLLGFKRGHDWRTLFIAHGGTATCLTCRRCGVNGWMF